MEIALAESVSIRSCGLDEYWLQDQICENPSCLGLGDLETVTRERSQSAGGRLDILLKNPEDDSMYEVEVMLGATDESHIIRTIEYWDNEKRRWPQRQHYAVLVAESVTRRFFNVIQLLSLSVPIIAIQVSIVAVGEQRCLHFSKVLDTYEEPEDGSSVERVYDESHWLKRSPHTVQTAKLLAETVGDCFGGMTLKYLQQYIALSAQSGNSFWNHFWVRSRKGDKSLMGFSVSEDRVEEAKAILDEADVVCTPKKGSFRFMVDQGFLRSHGDMLRTIAEIVRQRRE